MKLPKQLDAEDIESDVRAALEKESVELYSDSGISVPLFRLNPELRKTLFYAKTTRELIVGYEAITKALANELHGLKKVGNQSDRVSRLLIMTNDGSPRFRRGLEYLQKKQGARVLICQLDVDSATMAEILGVKNAVVKVVLLNRKTSVANALKSLV
jgi:hypothetical protein